MEVMEEDDEVVVACSTAQSLAPRATPGEISDNAVYSDAVQSRASSAKETSNPLEI